MAFIALAGIVFTGIIWLLVRVFPKQRYPEDNARVAAIGFFFAYYISFLSTIATTIAITV